MGSRSRRKNRDRLAAIVDPTGSVKPKAVAISPPQLGTQGAWGKSGSGLSPTEELRLVAQSFNWLSGERFPTHVPIDEIQALAQAENRRLTAPEVVVLTAAQFLDSNNEKSESYRQQYRLQRLAMNAAKLVLRAELMNQAEDHRNAGLAE